MKGQDSLSIYLKKSKQFFECRTISNYEKKNSD